MALSRLGIWGVSVMLGLSAGAAHAQDIYLDELRAGAFFHGAYQGFVPTSLNWSFAHPEDVKFSALFASPHLDALTWYGQIRPEIGATINLAGRESIVHANLNWQLPVFDSPVYVELGLGAALTTGALVGAQAGTRNFGCRVNFYESAGIGVALSDTVTATLVYEHTSNLGMCAANDGLSNLGLLVGVKF